MKKLRIDEMNRVDISTFKQMDKIPIVMVLDDIRSLHNVGSVFRTADAFCLQGVYLCGITAQPPHRDIQKTALGATESVDWRYFENTEDALESLRKDGYHIMAVEQAHDSDTLGSWSYTFEKPLALVMGNEVKGVKNSVMAMVDGSLEIPQFGTKHSLNVSVSAGIVMWEMFRQYQQTR